MTRIGSLVAELKLESAAFRRDLNRAAASVRSQAAQQRRAFQALNREARNLNRTMSQLKSVAGALAGAFAFREFSRFTRAAIDAGDAIGKTAAKVGLTTTELQQLRFAAEQTGVAQRTLDMAMQRFSRRLGEVAQGQGELLKTAEQYDVQLRDSEGRMRANVDVLRDFAEIMRNAESDQERLRIAFKLFDSEGAALVNTLKDGSGALQEFMDQAVAVGAVMDAQVVAQAERAADAMGVIRSVASTSFNTEVVRAFASSLELSADQLVSVREAAAAFGGVVGNAMRGLTTAARLVAENIRAITAAVSALIAFKVGAVIVTITSAMWRFVAALKAATSAQAAFNVLVRANPLAAIAGAISAALAVLVVYRDKTFEIGGTTVQVGKVIHATWVAVKEALMSVVETAGNLGRALAQLLSGDFKEMWKQFTAPINAGGFERVVEAWNDLGPAAKKAAESVEEVATAQAKANKSMTEAGKRVAERIRDLKSEVGQLEQQLFAVRQSEEAYQRARDAALAYNTVVELGIKTGTEEERVVTALVLKREQLTDAIQREREERARFNAELKRRVEKQAEERRQQAEERRQQAEREAELMMEPFKNAIQGVQQAFTDMFEQVFDGGINSFRDLASSIKRVFVKLAAEIAALMVFRPVVSGILGSIGLGGLGTALSGGGGSGGGGLLSGGLNFPTSPITSLLSGNNPLSGIGSAVSGLFGGGLAAGGSAVGTVAGTIGPAAGFAVPGASSLAGGAASAGAAGLAGLAPALGIAGLAIGGAALLGGLFGKKPSDKTQLASVDLRTGRIFNVHGLGGEKFSEENARTARQIAERFGQMARAAGGINKKLQVIIGNRDGLRFRIDGGPTRNVGNDPQALVAAIQAELKDDLDRARILGIIDNLRTTSSEYADSLDEVNKSWDKLIRRAAQLRISTDELVAARDREIQQLRLQARAPFIGAASNIVGFLNQQRISDTSSLSPTGKLREAQAQFGVLLDRVRSGDLGATRALTQSAGQVLAFGRDQFASSVDFAGLERFVRSSLVSVADQISSEDFFDANVEATQQQTTVLSQELQAVQDNLGRIRDELTLLRREMAA